MARTILLVEDDSAIATVIETAMADEGFDVVRCPSVAERDRLLSQRSFAVMLTDVVLEDGDGIDGLAQIARAQPRMRRTVAAVRTRWLAKSQAPVCRWSAAARRCRGSTE